MSQTTSKEVEETLIEEFLDHLGIRVVDLDVNRERPDAKLSCIVDDLEQTIGLDVTEYQVDVQSQGGSKSRSIESAWNHIWDRLQRESFPKYPQLHQLGVLLFFDEKNPPRTTQANQIADELTQFLVSVVDGITETRVFFSRRQRTFDGWDHLKACTDKLCAYRYPPEQKGPFHWQMADAAHVGIVSEVITSILAKKAKALKGYHLSGADEYWLLIAAGGAGPSSCAGPQWHCIGELRSQPIREAASQAGFDRIYFWERVKNWHERLYPFGLLAIEVPQSALEDFCQRNHIRRLAFFGSVLRGDFGPDSDIDVLVDFEPGHVPGLAFFAMQDELSALLGRPVDLNTRGFFRSPLRERVEDEAEIVYGPGQ